MAINYLKHTEIMNKTMTADNWEVMSLEDVWTV